MTAVAPVAPAPPAGEPAPTVVVEAVSKWMGPVVALSEVSFAIGPGVTALLGPNGAGKSTLLRILCGLTTPSQGFVRLLGVDPRTSLGIRRRIGLVAQQEALFEQLRAHELVALGAGLHGMARPEAAAVDALALVDLDPHDPRPVATYSKGMRQRVKVAHALVHEPDVVVLDEPLEGLDPRQRIRMIDLFTELGESGRTVVVSSHVLDEVERFGSRVLVLAQGRLAAQGDFHRIRELMDDRPHRLRVQAADARAVGARLLSSGAVVGAHLESATSLIVDTVDAPRLRRDVLRAAADVPTRLWEVLPLDEDLDSVFRYLVNR